MFFTKKEKKSDLRKWFNAVLPSLAFMDVYFTLPLRDIFLQESKHHVTCCEPQCCFLSLSVDKVSLLKFSLLNSMCVCRFKHLEKTFSFFSLSRIYGIRLCSVCVASVIMGLSRSQRFVFMRRMKLIEVSRLTCGEWQVEIVISSHLIPHLSRAQCADGLAGTLANISEQPPVTSFKICKKCSCKRTA